MIAMRKGSMTHELARLPALWLKMRRLPQTPLVVERHAYGPHRRQYYLFARERDGAARGLIVYFHGGGWGLGAPEMFLSYALVLAPKGWAVALPSCRRIPRYSFEDMLRDLLALRASLQEHSRRYGLEKAPWIAGGTSSGGHLGAHLALAPSAEAEPLAFEGLLLCGAPLDLSVMPARLVVRLMAGRRRTTRFDAANALNLIPRIRVAPKTLIIHGTRDGLVPFACASSFHQAYERRFQGRSRLLAIEEGTHLDAMSWVHSDNFSRREIFDFLDEWNPGV
jgi:acetyl esterase/lipase